MHALVLWFCCWHSSIHRCKALKLVFFACTMCFFHRGCRVVNIMWTRLMAHALTQALVQIDVEDLEVDATPEDLMLSYVSGEKGKVGY